jgi:hypothetical protein
MRTQLRLLMLIAALVAAITVAAGCGGGDASETSDRSASEILDETFQGGDDVRSGVLTVSLDADVPDATGATGATTLKLTGPFENPSSDDQLPSFDFDLSISASGQNIEAGAISTGDKGYLSLQGTDYVIPDQLFEEFRQGFVDAQKQADAQNQPTLQALGIDPSTWIEDPQKAGTEDVGGTATEHITGSVDVPKLLADLRKSAEQAGSAAGQAQPLTDQDVAAVRDQISSAKVDVYTGTEDLRLRRLVVDVTLKNGSVAFTLEIADLDEPQDISAPSDTRPLQELVQQFQSLFGGAAGTTTPDPGAGSGGGSGANQRYLECIQAAGEDLAKVQACAKLL